MPLASTMIGAGLLNKAKPTVSYLGLYTDLTAQTTYTFTNVAFGTPEADYGSNVTARPRLIIVMVHSVDDATTYTLNSGNIGGVAATLALSGAPASLVVSGCLHAHVPGGDSGTVTVTFSEAITGCAIAVYVMYDAQPLFWVQRSIAETVGTGNLDVLQSIHRSAYHITIAATTNPTAETCTFTSVTTNFDGFLKPMYSFDTGTFAGAGAMEISPNNVALHGGIRASWSGAGSGDLVGVSYISRWHMPVAWF